MPVKKKTAAKRPSGRKKAPRKRLKSSHEQFAAEFVANGGHGTKAAQAAFPNQSEQAAAVTASRLLRNAKILEAIQERTAAATGLSDNEVIGGLVQESRADITDTLDERGKPDIAKIRELGLGPLIKSITTKTYHTKAGVFVEVERVELYSSQTAKIQLSKILGIEKQPAKNPLDQHFDLARAMMAKVQHLEKRVIDRAEAERILARETEELLYYVRLSGQDVQTIEGVQ